jgi:alanyl-tRNA synthetase
VKSSRREDGSVEIHAAEKMTLPGDAAFRLYDTYGLSLDLLEDEGAFRGFRVDREGFERALEEQRTRARASWKAVHKEIASPVFARLAETFRTEPDFYFGAQARDCRIEAIVTGAGSVAEVAPGESAEVVLDRTVIYAESGGQVADTGKFLDNAGAAEVADVLGAYYPVAGLIAHRVVARERLRIGDRVAVHADGARREHIKRNHTGTHLVHAALRSILGTHVKQSGSLNDDAHLRFDFSHFTAVDDEELRDIEQQVNEHILRNLEVTTDIMPIDAALSSGALAFFGDKYPEQNVRVVTIPDSHSPAGFYSKELCGGTHLRHIGETGVFKIISEQSVAAGVRRIEAITGARALEEYQRAAATLRALAQAMNAREEELLAAAERMQQTVRQMDKQLEQARRKAAHSQVDDLAAKAREVKGVSVVAARVADADRGALRQLVDTLRQKLGSGVVVLGTVENGNVALIAGVTRDLAAKVPAGKVIQAVAPLVGGKGGGRPDLAEAGGKDVSGLETALAQVPEIVSSML